MLNDEYYYEMNALAIDCRHEWFIDETMPIDLINTMINKIKNLTIVFMDMGEVSGASTQFGENKLIFLNSKHSLGKQRFNLAHQFYHLKENEEFNICFENSNIEEEKKADQFASCLLLPHGALNYYEQINDIREWTWDLIIEAEQYFQICHQDFVRRLRMLEKITYYQYQKFKTSSQSRASDKGYSRKLYEPYTANETSIGYYTRLTNDIYDMELITRGKQDELFLDALRYDIVWGDY